MVTYFVWLLLCSDPKQTDCTIVKISQRMEWAQCWDRAAAKQDTLIKNGISNYKIWCSPRDYIKELESERTL